VEAEGWISVQKKKSMMYDIKIETKAKPRDNGIRNE